MPLRAAVLRPYRMSSAAKPQYASHDTRAIGNTNLKPRSTPKKRHLAIISSRSGKVSRKQNQFVEMNHVSHLGKPLAWRGVRQNGHCFDEPDFAYAAAQLLPM